MFPNRDVMVLWSPITRMSVDVERGHVVLTLSPPRARQLAAVIDEAGPHRDDWIHDTVALMLAAADRLGFRSHRAPRLSRREFLHNWHLDEGPSAHPPVSLASATPAEDHRTELSAAAVRPDERDADLAKLVHEAAEDAAQVAQEAVKHAASRAAIAAATAQAERSSAVHQAADAVAARVAGAAAAVQSEADAAALTVAQAAFDAALLIASTVPAGSERDAALTATLVATAVSAAAVKAAAVTAAARAEVARHAASAASAAALAAADAATMVDLEVACAAEAVLAVATATAFTLARQTDEQATALALTHC